MGRGQAQVDQTPPTGILVYGDNGTHSYPILVDSTGSISGFRTKNASLLRSGVKSADAAIKASPGAVYWMTVTDTAALAIELNDSTGGAGTDQWAGDFPAGAYAHFIFDPPLAMTAGIYLDVSTATCKVTIGYI